MTKDEFLKFFEEQVEREKKLFNFKEGVYGYNQKPIFENFTRGSVVLDLTPEKYLMSLVTKHFLTLAKTDFTSKNCTDLVFEYAQDIRAYMLLLMAMVKARTEGSLWPRG